MSFIPFLLMTDLFPFMRFGMFAETIQSTPQKEKFSLEIRLPDGHHELLSDRQIGLDESHLNYLARTYFYHQQLDFFAVHLKSSGLLKENERLIIIHKTLEGNHWKQDILFDQ
jgi:hypothetical protein